MLRLVSPAPFLEAQEMVLAGLRVAKPIHMRMGSIQLASSTTYGFLLDGDLLALIGFWPLAGGEEEVFLWGRPALEVAPHMLRLSRLAELTIRARAHSGVVGLRALVRHGNQAGERLARLAGFLHVAPRDAPAGYAPNGFSLFVRRLGEV